MLIGDGTRYDQSEHLGLGKRSDRIPIGVITILPGEGDEHVVLVVEHGICRSQQVLKVSVATHVVTEWVESCCLLIVTACPMPSFV